MVNLRELKLRNKTDCSCGHLFVANDISMLTKNIDFQFYGGRVGYYSELQCPDCKKEVVLLLEPYNCSYRIIDVGELPQKSNEFSQKISQNGNDIEKTRVFKCVKCQREFKTPQGLIAHQRSCIK